MFRIRVAAVSAIAAFTLTGLAQVAPASAHEYKVAGGSLKEYANVRGEEGTLFLEGTPFGVKTKVQCGSDYTNATGGLEAGGGSVLEASYGVCVVLQPAHCATSGVSLDAKGQLEGFDELEDRVTVGEPQGASWGSFTLEGSSCSLKGKRVSFTGTVACRLPETFSEQEAHDLVCDPEESANLRLNAKQADLQVTFYHWQLVNGLGELTHQTWSGT